MRWSHPILIDGSDLRCRAVARNGELIQAYLADPKDSGVWPELVLPQMTLAGASYKAVRATDLTAERGSHRGSCCRFPLRVGAWSIAASSGLTAL